MGPGQTKIRRRDPSREKAAGRVGHIYRRRLRTLTDNLASLHVVGIANRGSEAAGRRHVPIYLAVTKLTDRARSALCRNVAAKIRKSEMTNRASVYIIGAVIIGGICGVGVWTYLRNCHGLDACAAQSAESHERDKPSDPR